MVRCLSSARMRMKKKGRRAMKYMKTGSTDPCYNLAFEEYVLKNCKDDDYVLLWQNDNTIVFGINQNPLEEINMDAAKELGVNIVRRTTGGGAVYHDMGNLNFSYITDWDDGESSSYARFLEPITKAFAKIGLEVVMKGRNDLLLYGKKISGSAQRLLNGRILHHGTLLIDSDLGKISNVLNVSEDKIKSKGIKSVRSRVTNINAYADHKLDVEDIKNLLLDNWFNGEVNETFFEEAQLAEIRDLADQKYRSWDWVYGRSPKFNYKNRMRFEGGSIEVNLEVEGGIIQQCIIIGDFLSLQSIEDVEKVLIGIPFDVRAVTQALDPLPLELYFGSISRDEVLKCFREG